MKDSLAAKLRGAASNMPAAAASPGGVVFGEFAWQSYLWEIECRGDESFSFDYPCKLDKAAFKTHGRFVPEPMIRNSSSYPLHLRVWENDILEHFGSGLGWQKHMDTTAFPAFN